MPVTTFWSVPPIIPADTTDGVIGPCGAILGRYMHPKPSQLISNSTNDGVMAAPWRRMSRGVVMETRHFTRVSNTGPPFTGVNDALGLDTLLTTVSVDVVFKLFPVTTSTGDGDVSAFDNNEDDDETGCNLSIVPANVRPVSMSASRLASCCCSSLSAAQNNGAPSRRKSLPTASQFHTNTVRQTDRHRLLCVTAVWPHVQNKRLNFITSFVWINLLVCVSFTIIGQPRNSVLIRRV